MGKAGGAVSNHTPGHWSHDLDDERPEGIINAASGGCVAFVQHHGNVNTVLREGEAFSHADARLIAAAPELYEALKRIVTEAEPLAKGCPPAPHACSACEILHVASEAIAKAEGTP